MPRLSTFIHLSALSLLRHLRHEPLGCCLPVYSVSRFYRCALKCSASQVTLPANVAGTVMGIAFTYVRPDTNRPKTYVVVHGFGISWFSISLSLNVLLTIMIITRLVLHNRELRKALKIPVGTFGIYKTIVTMLVESFALYAGVFLLYITTWGPKNFAAYVFFPILAASQVRIALTFP